MQNEQNDQVMDFLREDQVVKSQRTIDEEYES